MSTCNVQCTSSLLRFMATLLSQCLPLLHCYSIPHFHTQLCLFAEGTRFTPEKHKVSVEFSKSRGYPVLKHHLFPRTKGFCFILKHMKSASKWFFMLKVASQLFVLAKHMEGYRNILCRKLMHVQVEDVLWGGAWVSSTWSVHRGFCLSICLSVDVRSYTCIYLPCAVTNVHVHIAVVTR